MVTLLVDFNAAQDGRVRGLTREADGEPVVGDLVLLDDGEGNQALGVLREVEDDLVYAEVDWSTWGKITGRLLTTVAETDYDLETVVPNLLTLAPA